jgi:hypothetical protein
MSEPDRRSGDAEDQLPSSPDRYGSFETADDELVVYDRRNDAAFVVSDYWARPAR